MGARRLGGEIVELVVEQHAGAFGDQAEAIAEIERIGVGDRVAEAVDHGEMRGVVAFAGRRGAWLADRPRAIRIDIGAQRRGIALRHQPRDRRAHHRRVAEIGRAVGIGALHRLDHQVRARSALSVPSSLNL